MTPSWLPSHNALSFRLIMRLLRRCGMFPVRRGNSAWLADSDEDEWGRGPEEEEEAADGLEAYGDGAEGARKASSSSSLSTLSSLLVSSELVSLSLSS